MADGLVLAALMHYHAQLERRLEVAADVRVPEVATVLAEEAIALLLASCDPRTAAELEAHRTALIGAVVAQRAALDGAVLTAARRLARPRFEGPVNGIFAPARRINTVIVGAPGGPLEYARVARDRFLPEAEVLEDTGLAWDDLADSNAVIYGTPSSPLVARLLAESGWRVAADSISIGGRTVEGEHLALIACRARPCDPTLADVVYTAFDERMMVGINLLHHGPFDVVIGRCTKVGRYQIVLRANFARSEDGGLGTALAA